MKDEGDIMFFILIIILLLISVGCFFEGENERKGLKLILSIDLAIMLSLFMEGTAQSLVASGTLEGTFLIILYYSLPIISFSAFNLLLYGIKIFD